MTAKSGPTGQRWKRKPGRSAASSARRTRYCWTPSADTERIRREAVAQIAERGLRERYSNGRQSLERENKAVGQAHKAAQTLGKLMAALKARQRKGQAGAQLPEGAVADELDDY